MVRWRRIALWLIGLVSVGGVCVAYAIAEETRLFALNSQTGHVQWSIAQLQRGHHSPQVIGDRLVVSQSNYQSDTFFGMEPAPPKSTGKQCIQQGWGLSAYDTNSGRELWIFCPDAQQFPMLDLKLTPGMQFQLIADHLYVPLLMADFPPRKKVPDRLLAINTEKGTPVWSIEQNFRQSLPFENKPYILNGTPQVSKRKVSSEAYGSSVVQVGQQVVVLTGQLQASVTLQAFSAATGKPTWKQKLPDRLAAEFLSAVEPITRNYLLANQQQVFQVSPIEGIIALDAQTGKLQFQTDGKFWGRTLVTDTAFYQFEPTAVSAYAATTGKRQWRHATIAPKDTETYGLLGTADQQTIYTRIYQHSKKGTNTSVQVFALNRNNGQEQWHKQFELPATVHVDIPPVVSAVGVTLVVSNPKTSDQSDLQLVTLDAKSGETQWRFPLNWTGDGKSVVRVYGLISSDSDQIFILDRASRFQHWLVHFN